MIGIEKVMETEFPCPCEPVLNQLLVVFMFITPALLAFIITMFLVRPCKHCSCCSCRKCCVKTFLPCLIPPVTWVIMLLLDGQYVACGLTFKQGNYVSDKDDPLVKWCKSSSSDETEEKQLRQHIVGLSQIAGFLVLSVICVITLCAVGGLDCCEAAEEDVELQNVSRPRPA
ncbi:calcium homeostasis modulator protein 2-like [Pygocentrus nattereri]|uniref:calcium homeostasis modulator protein 2-like n=1 Tax=Pygocentrus nattereri TaxID=42514 RepID=UPI00189106D3|nr:calcium homeostasis modulator protein 2-like [Pygocentrus nattereri]